MSNLGRDLLDLFDTCGWVQGASFRRVDTGYGGVCLMGGAALLSNGNPTSWHLNHPAISGIEDIEGVIRELYPDRCNSDDGPTECIVHFNDHTDTTLADVRAVLEKTAIKIEERVV